MRIITERPDTETQPLWRRLLWMVGLWAGGVLSVGVVAMALRWLLSPH